MKERRLCLSDSDSDQGLLEWMWMWMWMWRRMAGCCGGRKMSLGRLPSGVVDWPGVGRFDPCLCCAVQCMQDSDGL